MHKASLPAPVEAGPRRLTYKDQRALAAQKQELSELPARIEGLEAEQHHLSEAMAVPAFYQRDSAEITRTVSRLTELEEELSQAYARWEELENL